MSIEILVPPLSQTMDSLVLAPGASGEARFTADVEGTYYYWAAEPGVPIDDRFYQDSQLNGRPGD